MFVHDFNRRCPRSKCSLLRKLRSQTSPDSCTLGGLTLFARRMVSSLKLLEAVGVLMQHRTPPS